MSLFKSLAFVLIYFITMSKLGAKFDALDGALVGAAANLLFTRDKKEK